MNSLFIDTSAFVALQDRSDQNHSPAMKAWKDIANRNISIYTSNFVFDETYTLLLRRIGKAAAVHFGAAVMESQATQMIMVDEDIHLAAWQIATAYADKGFSFTDCTSFAIMEKLGVSSAFAFDNHFQQYGSFVVLPH